MKKYHSTLSRRDFLKALGLGGVGAGLSTMLPGVEVPRVNDLDDVMASPLAQHKRASWVKEVDKPTAEVDWNTLQRFDCGEIMFGRGFIKAMGQDGADCATKAGQANSKLWIKNNKPGFTLRDYALNQSSSPYAFVPHSYLGYKRAPTPDMLGVPRWEGTPEENTRMIRSVMRLYGADEVAVVEIDDKIEKLFYTFDGDGKKLNFEDVDEADEGEDYRTIPKKVRYVIVYTVIMSYEMVRRLPAWNAGPTVYLAYALGPFLQDRVQDFIRTLGYTCLGEARPNALATSVGLGVMGGLGEMCRIEHLITPGRGLSHRVFKLMTDLPLVPTKPINTGVMEFCKTCKKCAEACPAQAIPSSTEPSWNVPGPYKNPGVKGWFRLEPRCYSYWRETSTGCGYCLAVCPLNRPKTSSYFNTMRSTIAKTSVLNRTFRRMDDMLGWGARSDYENFWEMEMPVYGWD